MPALGELKPSKELGYKAKGKHMWAACIICGKERWVKVTKGQLWYLRCGKCAIGHGSASVHWRGGRRPQGQGYINVWVHESDPFYPMATTGRHYVLEHRLVMARSLGRCLLKTEPVHHINGIRSDNRIENLQLMSRSSHATTTQLCTHCELQKEIRLLKWKVKRLEEAVQGRLEEKITLS